PAVLPPEQLGGELRSLSRRRREGERLQAPPRPGDPLRAAAPARPEPGGRRLLRQGRLVPGRQRLERSPPRRPPPGKRIDHERHLGHRGPAPPPRPLPAERALGPALPVLEGVDPRARPPNLAFELAALAAVLGHLLAADDQRVGALVARA